MTMRIGSASILSAFLALACGAPNATEGDTEPPSGDIASTSEALSNCLAATADVTCTADQTIAQGCQDRRHTANYGQALCPHTAIMDVSVQAASSFSVAEYDGPLLNDESSGFPCSSMWVHRRIINMATLGVVDDRTMYSEKTREGVCLVPGVFNSGGIFGLPNGAYRILTSAGFITTYEPVFSFVDSDN